MNYNPNKKKTRMPEREQPIQPDLHGVMNRVADVLAKAFKPFGFALLVFPMDTSDGRMNYISNAERDTMLTAMKEFVAKTEHRHDETDAIQ